MSHRRYLLTRVIAGFAIASTLVLSLAISLPARAALVGLAFEGDLVFSTMSGITSGDTIRGGIVFNSSTPDALADPTQGFYAAPGAFSFVAGTFARSGFLDWIWVYDNYGNTPSDQFKADGYDGVDSTWYWFRLDLYAEGNTSPLSSDALPTSGLDFQAFGVHRLEIQTNNGAAAFDMTRLRMFSVPEPSSASLVLLALATAAMIGLGRRKKARTRRAWLAGESNTTVSRRRYVHAREVTIAAVPRQ